jgi:benzodiazapine receptor
MKSAVLLRIGFLMIFVGSSLINATLAHQKIEKGAAGGGLGGNMSNPSSRLISVANLSALVATFIVNTYAAVLGLNGRQTGQISDLYPVLITPPGYVFQIWTVIYILLLIYGVYQVLPSKSGQAFHGKIGYWFLLSCVANMVWLFAWHWGFIVPSVVPMFILLASLIMIYLRLDIGRAEVPLVERFAVHLPFSVYLGWITVAPIANVAAAFNYLGLGGLGLGEATWTALVIAIAVAITAAVLLTRTDIAYSLVIIWALAGVAIKQAAIQTVYLTAIAGIVIIAVVMVTAIAMRARGGSKALGR